MRRLGRLAFRLAAVPLALLTVLFAVDNRQPVTVGLWPLPWSVDMPLSLAVLGALAVGLVAGIAAGWASRLCRRRHSDASKPAPPLPT